MFVYSQNQPKHINTLCGQGSVPLDLKTGDACNNICASDG
jgi:hypothetical protein